MYATSVLPFAVLLVVKWIVFGEAASDDAEVACMLQSSLSTQAALPAGSGREQQIEYHLVPHHKSGTGMCIQAASSMNKVLADDPFSPKVDMRGHVMGHALSAASMQTGKPACFAQFARNPFEMVVSGYVYHLAGSDAWLERPLSELIDEHSDGCAPLLLDAQPSTLCQERKHDRWRGNHSNYRSLAQVFQSSHSGSLSALLPDVSVNETFPDYLKRVELDAGLIAEFIWASDVSLAPMRFTYDFAESQPCSVNMCFHEFYSNCNAAWSRLLQGWGIQDSRYDTLLEAAATSCPGVSSKAQRHSSSYLARYVGASHPAEHKMVDRLRELDRLHLGGAIAALERHVNCPVHGKYKDPANTKI